MNHLKYSLCLLAFLSTFFLSEAALAEYGDYPLRFKNVSENSKYPCFAGLFPALITPIVIDQPKQPDIKAPYLLTKQGVDESSKPSKWLTNRKSFYFKLMMLIGAKSAASHGT